MPAAACLWAPTGRCLVRSLIAQLIAQCLDRGPNLIEIYSRESAVLCENQPSGQPTVGAGRKERLPVTPRQFVLIAWDIQRRCEPFRELSTTGLSSFRHCGNHIETYRNYSNAKLDPTEREQRLAYSN